MKGLLQISTVFYVLLCGSVASAQFPPPGGGFGPPRFGMPPREVPQDRPERLRVDLKEPPTGLIKNPRFMTHGGVCDKNLPADYTLAGNAKWVWCGGEHEYTDAGIALESGPDTKSGNPPSADSGSVTQRVAGFESGFGRWYRFTIRGLAEPGFSVAGDQFYMKVAYFADKGANSLDSVTQFIYQYVEHDRKALATNGDFRKNGGAVWKTYAMEFRLPFSTIDTMDLSVGFRRGNAASSRNSAFYVNELALDPIPAPPDAPKISRPATVSDSDLKSLRHLGGRWYYKPDSARNEQPATLVVTAKNADRLFYFDGRLSNPFDENMTAWLRPGFLDLKGNTVTKDEFVPDNVVLEFVDGKDLLVHSRGICPIIPPPSSPTPAACAIRIRSKRWTTRITFRWNRSGIPKRSRWTRRIRTVRCPAGRSRSRSTASRSTTRSTPREWKR